MKNLRKTILLIIFIPLQLIFVVGLPFVLIFALFSNHQFYRPTKENEFTPVRDYYWDVPETFREYLQTVWNDLTVPYTMWRDIR